MASVHALVPAAGRGERLGGEMPKQYLEIAGKPVLRHTLEMLARHPGVERITVALAPRDTFFEALIPELPVPVDTVTGGASRAESVLNGLRRVAPGDWALVHDAARPCLPPECLDRLLATGLEHPVGAILAVPVRDTLKREGPEGVIESTVDRAGLWAAQTPQLFRAGELAEAIDSMLARGDMPTDEASAMESQGLHPALVPGSLFNQKITWPEDVALAEAWLAGHGRIAT